MRIVRWVRGLAAATLIGSLLAGAPPATASPAAPVTPAARPVHRATSGPPERALIFLVGYSHRYGIVYNDFSNGNLLAVQPDGTHARVLHTDAQAVSVAGEVIEYFRPSDLNPDLPDRYLDLAKHVHGMVPTRWMAVAPGGGVWVAKHRNGWHLYYDSDTARPRDLGVMTDLPNVRPLYFDIVASRRGVAVVASRANGSIAGVEYYPSVHRPFHRPLRTAGLPDDVEPTCPHLGTAVSCVDDQQDKAYAFDLSGRHRVRVRHARQPIGDGVFVGGRVHRLAITTFETVQGEDDEPSCPCAIRFDNHVHVGGLEDENLAANNTADPSVFFVKWTAAGPAIMRSHYGRGPVRFVRLAPLASA